MNLLIKRTNQLLMTVFTALLMINAVMAEPVPVGEPSSEADIKAALSGGRPGDHARAAKACPQRGDAAPAQAL